MCVFSTIKSSINEMFLLFLSLIVAIGTNVSTYPTRDGKLFNENMSAVLNELQRIFNKSTTNTN